MKVTFFKRIKKFFYIYDAYKLYEDFFSLPYSKGILNNYIIKRLNPRDFRRLYKIYFLDMGIDSTKITPELKEDFKYVFYKFSKEPQNIKKAKEAYAIGCLCAIAHPMATFTFRRFLKIQTNKKLEGFERVIIEYMANKFVIDNLDTQNILNKKQHQTVKLYNKRIIVHQSIIQKRIDKYIDKVAPENNLL